MDINSNNGFVNGGNGVSNTFMPDNSPVFSCDMGLNDNTVFCGGADGVLRACDPESNSLNDIGSHNNAIRVVKVEKNSNVIVTGGWDNTVSVWDPRSNNNPVFSENVNGKVYALDVSAKTLVVGNSNREILIYDFANNMSPVSCFESPMKLQTRSLSIFGEDMGVAIGSVEGRVAIEYFQELDRDRSKKQEDQQSFVYKCHRHREGSLAEVAYAINDIQFFSTDMFCTAGSDGLLTRTRIETNRHSCIVM